MTPTNNLTRIAIGLGLFIGFFFLSVLNVKAYDFTGINKVSRLDFGLYNDTTIVSDGQINCTSSNDGFCGFESADLPTTSATYNNLRFVIRGTDGKTFSVGTQYKISWYFSQYTTGYFIAPGTISQFTGNSYQNFSSWTSNDISIVSYSLIPLETSNSLTLYRVDVIFIPTSSTISGFNFRLYRDSKTLYSSDTSYMEFYRYMSISQIGNSSIDYTQDLNNINQSINDLSGDISSSTQYIIDNQNQNAQAIIDSNKSCVIIDKNKISIMNYSLNDLGNLLPNNTYGVTDYIPISSTDTLYLLLTTTASHRSCFYNINKTMISCFREASFSSGTQITIPSNASYFRATIRSTTDLPTFKLCKNGTQAISDSLTDTTPPDTSGLSNAAGWLPPGPVDSILNLPLTLLQSLNNAFSTGSCQPLVINFPHVSGSVPIPCMSTIWENFGLLPLFTWIGRVIGGILLYKYLINLYKWVDDTLTMRENNNFDDGSLG